MSFFPPQWNVVEDILMPKPGILTSGSEIKHLNSYKVHMFKSKLIVETNERRPLDKYWSTMEEQRNSLFNNSTFRQLPPQSSCNSVKNNTMMNKSQANDLSKRLSIAVNNLKKKYMKPIENFSSLKIYESDFENGKTFNKNNASSPITSKKLKIRAPTFEYNNYNSNCVDSESLYAVKPFSCNSDSDTTILKQKVLKMTIQKTPNNSKEIDEELKREFAIRMMNYYFWKFYLNITIFAAVSLHSYKDIEMKRWSCNQQINDEAIRSSLQIFLRKAGRNSSNDQWMRQTLPSQVKKLILSTIPDHVINKTLLHEMEKLIAYEINIYSKVDEDKYLESSDTDNSVSRKMMKMRRLHKKRNKKSKKTTDKAQLSSPSNAAQNRNPPNEIIPNEHARSCVIIEADQRNHVNALPAQLTKLKDITIKKVHNNKPMVKIPDDALIKYNTIDLNSSDDFMSDSECKFNKLNENITVNYSPCNQTLNVGNSNRTSHNKPIIISNQSVNFPIKPFLMKIKNPRIKCNYKNSHDKQKCVNNQTVKNFRKFFLIDDQSTPLNHKLKNINPSDSNKMNAYVLSKETQHPTLFTSLQNYRVCNLNNAKITNTSVCKNLACQCSR